MRNAKRFPLKLRMDVKNSAEDHEARTSNISSGGVLFEVDEGMPVGSTIEFTITMPKAELGTPGDVHVNCVGRVVRCTESKNFSTVAAVIDDYKFERPKES